MTEYSEEDFSELMYPVHSVKQHLDPLKAFPNLSKYPEFEEGLSGKTFGSELFRYIVYTYDKKSPFVRDYDNIIQRKKNTAKYAGFKHTKGRFSKTYLEIMDCRDFTVNKMIVRYCRMQTAKWDLLVAGQESYYNTIQELISTPNVSPSNPNPAEDSVKNAQSKMKLFGQATEMFDELESLKRSIFSKDNNNYIMEDVYRLVEEEIIELRLSPESRASHGQEE